MKRTIVSVIIILIVIAAVVQLVFLSKEVLNSREYYLDDDTIRVTYDAQTTYNPLTKKYKVVGAAIIDGYDFIIDGEANDSMTFKFKLSDLSADNDEYVTIDVYADPDYHIQLTEPVGMIIDADYSGSGEGTVTITNQSNASSEVYFSK